MKKTFKPVSCLIPALIAALLVGIAVYVWQQRELKTTLKLYQKTDEQQIREVAVAECEAQVGYKAKVTEVKINSTSAFAGLGCYQNNPEASGYGLVLKKVNGVWVIIYKNQQTPGKNVCQKFGLSKEHCSQDYDSIGY